MNPPERALVGNNPTAALLPAMKPTAEAAGEGCRLITLQQAAPGEQMREVQMPALSDLFTFQGTRRLWPATTWVASDGQRSWPHRTARYTIRLPDLGSAGLAPRNQNIASEPPSPSVTTAMRSSFESMISDNPSTSRARSADVRSHTNTEYCIESPYPRTFLCTARSRLASDMSYATRYRTRFTELQPLDSRRIRRATQRRAFVTAPRMLADTKSDSETSDA